MHPVSMETEAPVPGTLPVLPCVHFIWLFICIIYNKRLALVVKNQPANAGDVKDMGSNPGSGKSPGGEQDNPLQYSCLAKPMDRGASRATVHRVAQSRTRLKRLSKWKYGTSSSSESCYSANNWTWMGWWEVLNSAGEKCGWLEDIQNCGWRVKWVQSCVGLCPWLVASVPSPGSCCRNRTDPQYTWSCQRKGV